LLIGLWIRTGVLDVESFNNVATYKLFISLSRYIHILKFGIRLVINGLLVTEPDGYVIESPLQNNGRGIPEYDVTPNVLSICISSIPDQFVQVVPIGDFSIGIVVYGLEVQTVTE
jgi:hypothetical protein